MLQLAFQREKGGGAGGVNYREKKLSVGSDSNDSAYNNFGKTNTPSNHHNDHLLDNSDNVVVRQNTFDIKVNYFFVKQ